MSSTLRDQAARLIADALRENDNPYRTDYSIAVEVMRQSGWRRVFWDTQAHDQRNALVQAARKMVTT